MAGKSRNGAPTFGDEDFSAVQRVLERGDVSHGPEISRLEQNFAQMTGKKYAVAFNSWTSAAYSLLMYLGGVRGRSEIVIPSFTFSATGNVVLNAGFTPVFAEVSEENFALVPESVEAAISPETLAIMVVHYAGHYDHQNTVALQRLAEKHGLLFLEDCAESLGAVGQGVHCGSLGTSIFSLYATKGISCGEGGVCATDDSDLAEWMERFRGHGVVRNAEYFWRRDAVIPGQNFRLANLNAALAVSQLERLEQLLLKRREVAQTYFSYLRGVKSVALPAFSMDGCSWQMFPILVPPEVRDLLVFSLHEDGIGASVHFDPPLHQQAAFQDYSKSFPVTDSLSARVVTIPIHGNLTVDEAVEIAVAVRDKLRALISGFGERQ